MNGWSYLCVDKEMLFVGRIWDEIWRIYTSAGLYWSVVEYLYFLETLFESKLFGLYQPSGLYISYQVFIFYQRVYILKSDC